jgi:predicted esterase
MPALIEHFAKKFKIKGDKFHMAGHSNGGLSAFRIALKNRKRISSLTVFPGFPSYTRDFERLTRLKKIKVNIFVNDSDKRWKAMTDFTAERLKTVGVDVQYKVFSAKGHKVTGLAGPNSKVLFEAIER